VSAITADTLIVHGDPDPFYPPSIAFELYRAVPRSYLWVVPNGGHGPIFGPRAESFVETALEFLGGGWKGP
jgi:pimeloyl-ACP methyl ester carboxylesterase